MRILIKTFIILIIIISFILLAIYYFIPTFALFPIEKFIYDHEATEEGYIDTHDNKHKLHYKWFDSNKDDSPIILFFHGNRGNLSYQHRDIKMFKKKGIPVYMFDYSGFGKSEGKADVSQLLEDGKRMYEFVAKRHGQENVILWANSMGGVPASYVASIYKPCAAIFVSCFSDTGMVMQHLSNKMFPKGGNIIKHVFNKRLEHLKVEKYMENINTDECKVCLVHVKNDELIPEECVRKNMQALARNPNYNEENILSLTVKGSHSMAFLGGVIDELWEFVAS